MTIKEYTGRANIRLIHGDCMEFMKDLGPNAYELAICDPPYGIGIDGQKENIKGKKSDRKKHDKKSWDNSIPSSEYFKKIKRISDNQIIWGANYFVKNISTPSKGWVVWYKGQQGLTMSDCEIAFTSFDRPTRVFIKNRVELLIEGTIHPTQKPVALYKWLLTNYAKEGDKILDTHGGSMSIAIACWDKGFDLDLIELDTDYYAQGVERFERHIRQLQMF